MIVTSAAEMRALDRWTIEHRTPGHVLMERAGAGAVKVLRRHWKKSAAPVVIVCGRGNNGGDGFVMARLLQRAGWRVSLWLAAAPEAVQGDAARMLAAWRKARGRIETLRDDADLAKLRTVLPRAALVVDALFGTGLNAPLTGHMAAIVDAINTAGRPVLAVDIASGLSADTGQALGVAVRADVTATFAFAKLGQCIHPGVELGGTLEIVDIGIPAEALDAVGVRGRLFDAAQLAPLLAPRKPDSHKGTYGHVLVIAGAAGTTGAALLATEAAGRSGAGLTTVASTPSVQPLLAARVLEAMTASTPPAGDAAALDALLANRTAVVCGPGLGTAAEARDLVAAVVARCRVPLVLDADGLNAVAGTPLLRGRPAATVVTPHPGEMARLAGVDTKAVQADRVGIARRFAAGEGVVVVLKGSRTVVAAPDGRIAICPTGNPGMASGGMGDVLSGVIGGLLAQRLDPFDAACFGVYVHGAAGDAAAAERGTVGLLARDLLDRLPAAIRSIQHPPH